MIFFDIVTLIVVCCMIFKGVLDGFISQFLSLVGIILGIALAISSGESLGTALGLNPTYASIVGFIIIFVATAVIAVVLAKLLSKVISFIKLSWLNTLLGVVFAVIKGLTLLGLIYAAIFAVNERIGWIEEESFDKSVSFNVVRTVADPLLDYWEESKPLENFSNRAE